jgi:hypothetical protein
VDPVLPERPLFKLRCERCLADADTDAVFELHAVILAPESNLALLAITCETCGTDSDMAIWPIVGEMRGALAGPAVGPQQASLVDRYAHLMDAYRQRIAAERSQWLAAEEPEFPFIPVDLERLDLEWPLTQCSDRPVAIPVAALAAVRGAREVVEAADDGEYPQVRLQIGHLTCVLSRDDTPRDVWPWAIHLSVSSVAATAPAPIEQHLALALCFRPEELPCLAAQPGERVPVMHFFLGEPAAD